MKKPLKWAIVSIAALLFIAAFAFVGALFAALLANGLKAIGATAAEFGGVAGAYMATKAIYQYYREAARMRAREAQVRQIFRKKGEGLKP